MLSNKILYDELKALIIDEYKARNLPTSSEKEVKVIIEDAKREAKIELLEKILELK